MTEIKGVPESQGPFRGRGTPGARSVAAVPTSWCFPSESGVCLSGARWVWRTVSVRLPTPSPVTEPLSEHVGHDAFCPFVTCRGSSWAVDAPGSLPCAGLAVARPSGPYRDPAGQGVRSGHRPWRDELHWLRGAASTRIPVADQRPQATASSGSELTRGAAGVSLGSSSRQHRGGLPALLVQGVPMCWPEASSQGLFVLGMELAEADVPTGPRKHLAGKALGWVFVPRVTCRCSVPLFQGMV